MTPPNPHDLIQLNMTSQLHPINGPIVDHIRLITGGSYFNPETVLMSLRQLHATVTGNQIKKIIL